MSLPLPNTTCRNTASPLADPMSSCARGRMRTMWTGQTEATNIEGGESFTSASSWVGAGWCDRTSSYGSWWLWGEDGRCREKEQRLAYEAYDMLFHALNGRRAGWTVLRSIGKGCVHCGWLHTSTCGRSSCLYSGSAYHVLVIRSQH